jgi:uncharacterized protein
VSQSEVLSQAFELGFTYTRSTGPVVGRFLTELRARKLVGIKASDGRVIVPPMEYDPDTAEALSEFVEVGQVGEVVSWCWVKEPRSAHPLEQPFAWAMIKLDGADIPMIHCVAAAAESEMATGARVRAVWADEPQGFITDIRCFELADGPAASAVIEQPEAVDEREVITAVEAPIYLNYNFTAGKAPARFLSQLKKGILAGQRCPSCSNVYVPPRGSCAACGVATEQEVELPDKATVESFTIVAIPIPNNPIKPPFVIANLVLDGANISFIHLMSECVNDEVHIGQRVQALWKPESEWGYTMDNIRYFKPLQEPDVPVAMIGKIPVEGWEG